MADLSGQRLGPFEIHGLLGVGGFATVYRAHDPRLRSDVAIKILAENHALEPRIRERFIGEAHALRRVQSENVVTVFDIRETDDGRPYLVLEFADRGDLRSRRAGLADRGQAMRPDDVRVLVESMSDALEAIHAEELVHRDVTPANVLIGSTRRRSDRPHVQVLGVDERLLLSDLGLVKDLAAGSGLTVGGGTAGFWAPEQRTPLAAVDHRTDLFAASGVVIWLLTGHAPVVTPDWPDRLAKAGWSPAFVAVLAQGLEVEPDDRPATSGEWRDRILGQLAHEAPVPAPVRTTGAGAVPTAITPPADQAVAVVGAPGASDVSDDASSLRDAPTLQPVPASAPTARRPVTVRLLAGVAAGAVAVALAFVLLRSGPLNPDALPVEGEMISVTTEIDGSQLTIVGPERFEIGEPVRYRTVLTDVTEVVWTGPDGQRWTQAELEVEAAGPGRGEVIATGRTGDGRVIETTLVFDIEG